MMTRLLETGLENYFTSLLSSRNQIASLSVPVRKLNNWAGLPQTSPLTPHHELLTIQIDQNLQGVACSPGALRL